MKALLVDRSCVGMENDHELTSAITPSQTRQSCQELWGLNISNPSISGRSPTIFDVRREIPNPHIKTLLG
jgi:hypothetical protein